MAGLDWEKAKRNPRGYQSIKDEPSGRIDRMADRLLSRDSKPKKIKKTRAKSMPAASHAKLTIYFDGGCAPNPGKMSSCIVICRPGVRPEAHVNADLGYGTNNVAEWSGLVWATLWARDNGITALDIVGDSKLAVNQAQGLWKINNEALAGFYSEFKELSQGMSISLRHVLRDSNLAGVYLEHGRL